MTKYNEKNQPELPKNPSQWPVIVASLLAALLWLANWLYAGQLPSSERGTFGDMFGAVNSLFSGFAFVGVVYAITMQRHEISIARQDIRYTKEILDSQNDQLKEQIEESRKQSFEVTFFQLVSLFSEITNQIDLQKNLNGKIFVTKGKDVFPVFLHRLKKKYNPPAKAIYGGHDFEAAYDEFYAENNSEIGHYFRTLYNIIKFIDAADIKEKTFYSNLIRAQLSDAEVAVLFHNGLSRHGREKFKPLIERYALLKYVDEKDLLDTKMMDDYNESAFGQPTN